MCRKEGQNKTAHRAGPGNPTREKDGRLKATDIAARSGRARNVLYRLERGKTTLASLFDILRAMDLTISLERLGMPTLEEVTERFGQDDDDAS